MTTPDQGEEKKNPPEKTIGLVVGVVAAILVLLALGAAVYTFTQRGSDIGKYYPQYTETVFNLPKCSYTRTHY